MIGGSAFAEAQKLIQGLTSAPLSQGSEPKQANLTHPTKNTRTDKASIRVVCLINELTFTW